MVANHESVWHWKGVALKKISHVPVPPFTCQCFFRHQSKCSQSTRRFHKNEIDMDFVLQRMHGLGARYYLRNFQTLLGSQGQRPEKLDALLLRQFLNLFLMTHSWEEAFFMEPIIKTNEAMDKQLGLVVSTIDVIFFVFTKMSRNYLRIP